MAAPAMLNNTPTASPYCLAQRDMADLKVAVYELLSQAPEAGLSNSTIGRTLGIYHGHVGHEGHIPRTLLAIMESEGAVDQDAVTKKWHLRKYEEAGGD